MIQQGDAASLAVKFAELCIKGETSRSDLDDWVWDEVDCLKYTDDEMDSIVSMVDTALKTRIIIKIN